MLRATSFWGKTEAEAAAAVPVKPLDYDFQTLCQSESPPPGNTTFWNAVIAGEPANPKFETTAAGPGGGRESVSCYYSAQMEFIPSYTQVSHFPPLSLSLSLFALN